MLLAEGANKDAADNGGATPMIIAAEICHAEVLKMLLAAGANKDAAANDGVTPMYFAAQNGHAEVLQMLLAAGANKDAANNEGVTPVHWAAKNGHAAVQGHQHQCFFAHYHPHRCTYQDDRWRMAAWCTRMAA